MSYLKIASLVLLSSAYIWSGFNHLENPDVYLRLMPPYLPMHEALVFVSGVTAAGLGVALLIPRLRRAAAWGIVAWLIAVFPANVHMALADIPLGPVRDGFNWFAWSRLPLQAVLIAWAWWHTLDASPSPEADHRSAGTAPA